MTVKVITPQLGERQNEFNMQKFEQLDTYTVRDLDCGITARVHPEADEISRLNQWLRDHQMHTIFDEKTFEGFLKTDCPRVLSMTHPDSTFAGTLWIAKLTTMFFLADDFLETLCGEFAPDTPNYHLVIEWNMVMFWSFPRNSDEMISKLLALFDDYADYRKSIEDLCQKIVAEGATHPFGAGFQDLWQKAITVMPKEWSLRLAASFNSYFSWHIRESVYRKKKMVPTIEEYVIHRTGSGGMQMLLGPGADYVDGNVDVAPDKMYNTPIVQHLLDAANVASCLFNDIYSFPKELRNGEYHNMVVLVSYWRQCTYNEAVELVMRMVEDINEDIILTSAEITRTAPPQHRNALDPTMEASRNSIPVHNVFHKTSYRYAFNKPLIVVVSE